MVVLPLFHATSSTFGQGQRTADSPINALISAKLSNPDLINFAAGLVDEPTLPVEEVREIAGKLLPRRRAGSGGSQYGTAIGLRELRRGTGRDLERLDGKTPGGLAVRTTSS